jgi:integrase
LTGLLYRLLSGGATKLWPRRVHGTGATLTRVRNGARCELIALDLFGRAAGLLTVRRTLGRIGGKLVVSEPKTDRSRRTLPLGAPLVAMLRARRKQQAAEQLRAANQWQNSGLVFTTELGTPVEPRNILRTVETAAAKAGMEGVGAYTLALGGRGVARGGRTHQSGGRSARAFVHRGDRGHLRTHVG